MATADPATGSPGRIERRWLARPRMRCRTRPPTARCRLRRSRCLCAWLLLVLVGHRLLEPGIFGSFTRRDASGDQEGRNRWPPLVCRAAPGLSSPAAVERD